MQSLPKISIVTPSFNQGQYIEQTILSIIDQGYPNYELIIIDGGSTDNTVEIIKKYESNIAYWVSEKDNGQADALNKGIARATGDIFNWINSDDYLEPGALEVVGQYFKNNPKMHVLCGFTHCFYDEDKSTSHTYRMGLESTATDTIINIAMNQPGTFYRTEVVRSVGGINPSLRYIFDNELWFKFLCKYGIDTVGTTDKLLAQFRLHKDSKSVFEGFELFNKESKDIWLFLANKLSFDATLIELMKEEVPLSKYQSPDWDYTNIDKVKIESFFAGKYMLTLLQMGKYNIARSGWRFRYKTSFKKDRRMLLSTFIKLFLVPGYLKK